MKLLLLFEPSRVCTTRGPSSSSGQRTWCRSTTAWWRWSTLGGIATPSLGVPWSTSPSPDLADSLAAGPPRTSPVSVTTMTKLTRSSSSTARRPPSGSSSTTWPRGNCACCGRCASCPCTMSWPTGAWRWHTWSAAARGRCTRASRRWTSGSVARRSADRETPCSEFRWRRQTTVRWWTGCETRWRIHSLVYRGRSSPACRWSWSWWLLSACASAPCPTSERKKTGWVSRSVHTVLFLLRDKVIMKLQRCS